MRRWRSTNQIQRMYFRKQKKNVELKLKLWMRRLKVKKVRNTMSVGLYPNHANRMYFLPFEQTTSYSLYFAMCVTGALSYLYGNILKELETQQNRHTHTHTHTDGELFLNVALIIKHSTFAHWQLVFSVRFSCAFRSSQNTLTFTIHPLNSCQCHLPSNHPPPSHV